MVDRSFAEHLETEWNTLAELCTGLTAREWDLPTDCPGWTVKDQLAHLLGTETFLSGRKTPDLDGRPNHVHNDLGAFNEAWIDSFRDMPGDELLSRFVAVTAQRLGQLRAMTDDELVAETDSPVGRIPYHRFMEIRLMDCWVHEQDIRGAVGKPGGLHGAPAETAIDKLLQTLGYVVGKKVRPPENAVIVVRLDGPVKRERAVEVSGGRARPVESSGDVTSLVVTDAATFARLAAGRWSAEYVLASGLVEFEHDEVIGRSVVQNLTTTP